MRFRTTFLLLVIVLLLGAAYWRLEGHREWDDVLRSQLAGALRFTPERISYVRFEQGDSVIECEKQEGAWRILEPVRTRASAGEVDRLLTGMSGLALGQIITARERRAHELSLSDYGLARPRARLTWGDDVSRRTLLVGRASPFGDEVYVMEEGGEDVLSTSAHLLELFPASVNTLRDRVLIYGDPARTHRIEIRRPEGFLQLVRDEDGIWRMQQPLVARADRARIQALLEEVFALRIEQFVADHVSDMTVYGLDDTSVRVTLWTDTREAGASFYLGGTPDQQPEMSYARRHEGESIFMVRRDVLTALQARPEELRDRDLIPWLPNDIGAVRLQQEGETILLRRDERNVWRVGALGNWLADEERVQALLDRWTGVRVEQYVEDRLEALVRLGFSEESKRIEFERKDAGNGAQRSVTIALSSREAEDQRIAVYIPGDQAMYTIADDVLGVTVFDAAHYRNRVVFRIPSEEIRGLHLVRNGTEQRVVRDGQGDFSPVDRSQGVLAETLPELLHTVGRLRALTYVADRVGDMEPYGLNVPHASLSIELAAPTGIRRTLLFGERTEEGSMYARTRGHQDVFLLDAETVGILLSDLYKVPAVQVSLEENDTPAQNDHTPDDY